MRNEAIRVFGVMFMNELSGFTTGKVYYYKYDSSCQVGDIVVVDTKFGANVAQIVKDVEATTNYELKEIMINITSQHKDFVELAATYRKKEAMKKMNALMAKMDEQIKYKMYAEMDDEFAALYNTVYGEE